MWFGVHGDDRQCPRTLSTSLVSAVIDGLMALITFALMWIYAPCLALISVGACVVYGAIRYFSYEAPTVSSFISSSKQSEHMVRTYPYCRECRSKRMLLARAARCGNGCSNRCIR